MGRGERQRPRVPRRGSRARAAAICFAEAARQAPRGRRRRRQPPPLRPRPRHGRRAPARPRGGRDRRGPPARGHHLGHQRRRAHRRPLHRPGPPRPRRDRRRPAPRRASTTPVACSRRPSARTATGASRAACPTTWPAPSPWLGAASSGPGRRPERARDAPEETPLASAAPPCSRRARSSRTSAPSSTVGGERGGVGGGHRRQPDAARRAARRGRPPAGRAVGQAHRPCSPAPRSPPGSPSGSGSPPPRSPSSMSAARSTTTPTRSSTAPPTSPTPAARTYVDALTDELGRAHRGGRRPHAGAVHELPGARRGRRRAPAAARRARSSPSATCPRRACSSSSPTTRPPACSPPWASGRASTCPGASLSLVTIDRIPFPRPDEPLLQARRERAGADAFGLIDLPRAATLLAQGAGRLIRSADRPRRRRRPRPPPGHRRLPLGRRARPPAHAAHEGPRRGAPHRSRRSETAPAAPTE